MFFQYLAKIQTFSPEVTLSFCNWDTEKGRRPPKQLLWATLYLTARNGWCWRAMGGQRYQDMKPDVRRNSNSALFMIQIKKNIVIKWVAIGYYSFLMHVRPHPRQHLLPTTFSFSEVQSNNLALTIFKIRSVEVIIGDFFPVSPSSRGISLKLKMCVEYSIATA